MNRTTRDRELIAAVHAGQPDESLEDHLRLVEAELEPAGDVLEDDGHNRLTITLPRW